MRSVALVLVAASLAMAAPRIPEDPVLWQEPFDYPDGLITNEFAQWNPNDPRAALSPRWDMTSGSLFALNRTGWTGVPDHDAPDPGSRRATNSSVFRLTSRRADFGDVAVDLTVYNRGLSTTTATPANDWDGIHVWVRYQSQTHLYYASLQRRDDTVVIKKKMPGGPSNDGTYYPLGLRVFHATRYNAWMKSRVTVQNQADGSVRLGLWIDGEPVMTVIDDGVGGPPIREPGRIGIRGDNCEFQFDEVVVRALSGAAETSPPKR